MYKIQGYPLVVKFPLNEEQDFEGGVAHSISEVRRINRLFRIPELKPHLPKVHYHDKKNGVLVMSYYPRPGDVEQTVEVLGRLIQKLVYRIARIKMSDIHADNVRCRRPDWQSAVFIDLGY